ncbi:MAG: outer membrane lipoprotein-sorting protein [Kiritimatiellae bacterium]|nr:outer membrane lipoprotein-sorting protein [Kiritimatiellia bacterium]
MTSGANLRDTAGKRLLPLRMLEQTEAAVARHMETLCQRSLAAIAAAALCAFAPCSAALAQDAEDADIEKFFAGAAENAVLHGDYSAEEVLAAARAMLPDEPLELRGSIVRRGRKGFAKQSCDYTLKLDRSQNPATMEIKFFKRGEGPNGTPFSETHLTRPGKVPEGNIIGTDVTWWDLTLDFLWWENPRFEEGREAESVHGQTCGVILVTPPDPAPEGIKAVRLWAEKRTGCLMQAEALGEDMKTVRRLWGTRVRKFGERWMANVLEVETTGTHHRTKIIVDDLIIYDK